MPIMKLCIFPGCRQFAIAGKCYCTNHYVEKKPFQSATRSNNYNTAEWRQLRKEVIQEHPYCDKCGREDHLQVHHILPPRGNTALFYDKNNLQVLCIYCHAAETGHEVHERNNK